MSDDTLALLLIFGLPVTGWILSRIMRHRERMAMLERGIVPPERGGFGRSAARGGFNPPPWTAPPLRPDGRAALDPDAQCGMRRGIMTAMVGFALLIGLSFIGWSGGDGVFGLPSIRPGPWLLGGLIPMFVGLAQILNAVLSGAQFTLRPMPGPLYPPPPPGNPGGMGGPAQPGYSGPTYEELARPVKPPDRL